MKYLKKFEAVKIATEEEIREICKDALVELVDKGFNVNVDQYSNTRARTIYEVSLNRYIYANGGGVQSHPPKPFFWHEVADSFLLLVELLRSEFLILKSMGYEIEIRDDNEYFYNYTIDELIEQTDSGNYKENNGRKLNTLPLSKITIFNVT